MKRFTKIAISLLLVFSFVFSLAACGKDDKGDVTVSSIKVVDGTYPTAIEVGETPNFANIKVEVTYSDSTTKVVGYEDLTLSALDTSTEGIKTLTVTYEGKTATVNINVGDVSSSVFISDISLPANYVARNGYMKNFKDQSYAYFVGDDNPFLFYVNVIMFDSNDELVDVDGKTVVTETKVYLVDTAAGTETELTGDELTAMVVKDEAKNTYDFTEAAIGKTFRLAIKPLDYFGDFKSITVEIVDAYNIYSAKELNLLTNEDDDLDGSFGEDDLSQLEAVNKFLAANGITRPEKLAGIVLHDNINITTADIPAEYIYNYEVDGVKKQGLYDWEYIFNHKINSSTGTTFSMYGNYYTIYSHELPGVAEAGQANNDDNFSSAALFALGVDTDMNEEHFNHKDYTYNVIGIAFRDMAPSTNNQADAARYMLGFNCLNTSYSVVNITNSNIEAFPVSMVPDCDDQTVNLTKVKFFNAWQGHLFIWNTNGIDSENDAPRPEYQNIKVNIVDSSLTKCGGPVILSQNVDPHVASNALSGADIVVDDKSVLESNVTGQEAWFVAVGQSNLVMQIMALDNTITASLPEGVKASFVANDRITDSKVNTINMIYVNMGVGTAITGGEKYRGTFTIAENTITNMTSNPVVDAYISATGGQAPIFQSSAGGTAFSNGENACYGIETGAPGAPTPNFFEGDYITLYYMGLGILFEYNH